MIKNKIGRTSLYLIIVCSFLLIVNATLGIVLALQSSDALKSLIRDRMLDVSNTAADMIDGDILGTITAEDENTPEYRNIMRTLTCYQDNIELSYICCIRDLGNKNVVITLDPTVSDPAEFGEPIVFTDALYEASFGTSSVDKIAYEDRWGRFYSAYSPVFDSKGNVGGIVAVDFSADWYEEKMKVYFLTILMISAV